MEVKQIEIEKIKPYENNAKRHPQSQIDNIIVSINKFGFTQPIVLDKDFTIIIGHGRLEAAKQLGYEKVPCVMLDNLTEEEVKQLRIIDNKTNESDWDIEKLQLELEEVKFDDFSLDWGGVIK